MIEDTIQKKAKKAKKEAKHKRFRELEDLKKVLSSRSGRNVLWKILGECGTFRSVMTGSSYTFFNAGKQDLGHYLMAEIEQADQDALFEMMKENKQQGEDSNVRREHRATK